MSILELIHVTKHFGGLTAVDDVSFAVNDGELLGIAGPNGSGKSTLFNVITGIPYHASAGQIRFAGQPITGAAPHRIARLGLVRTFQKDAEFPDLSARETLSLAASYGRGLDRRAAQEATEAQLDTVEFDASRADMSTTELSVYERKQLMIA
ncbi:MAG: ATP-binding cassette domain-containing protein, partial [Pseudomonadota bacterium]